MTTVGRHIEQLFLLSYSTRSTAIQCWAWPVSYSYISYWTI